MCTSSQNVSVSLIAVLAAVAGAAFAAGARPIGSAEPPESVASPPPAEAANPPAALQASASYDEELHRARDLARDKPKAALSALLALERARGGSCLECALEIARVRLQLRDFEQAEAAARRALELSEDTRALIQANGLLGRSFYERAMHDASQDVETDLKRAETAYRRAFELDEGRSEEVRWNLASALEWIGGIREANVLWGASDTPPAAQVADSENPENEGERAGPRFLNEDITKPVKVADRLPEYTPLARKARLQGVVIVQTVIDKEGRLTEMTVLKPLPGLTLQALRALQEWRFEPATLAGDPVAVYFNLTVGFALE